MVCVKKYTFPSNDCKGKGIIYAKDSDEFKLKVEKYFKGLLDFDQVLWNSSVEELPLIKRFIYTLFNYQV